MILYRARHKHIKNNPSSYRHRPLISLPGVISLSLSSPPQILYNFISPSSLSIIPHSALILSVLDQCRPSYFDAHLLLLFDTFVNHSISYSITIRHTIPPLRGILLARSCFRPKKALKRLTPCQKSFAAIRQFSFPSPLAVVQSS
jgi:hypothetical protein